MSQFRTRAFDKPRAVDTPFAKQAGIAETDVQGAIAALKTQLDAVSAAAAPKTAQYLVGASDATLTAERVVTDTATIAWDLATASQAKASVVDASISYAKIQDVAALSLIGRAGNAAGVSAAITAAADFQVMRRSGTSIAFGAVALDQAAAISGDLPFSALAQLAGLSVAGVTGASTADLAAITAAADFQVLRRSGSAVSFGAIDLSQAAAITGDLPLSALAQGTARSVLGVTGNATADYAAIQGTADQVLVINGAGTALTFATVATAGITAKAVTYAKIQDISAQYRLLGRSSSGAGVTEEITTSAFALTVLDDADAATALATLTAAGQGRRTQWVPASAMISRTTNGAASGTTEMATNKNMFRTFDFDTTTQEFVQFEVFFPKSWNLGTVTFQPMLSHASGSGNVVFGLAGVARSNDDAGDVAFGTPQTSDRTVGTANDIYIGPESSAITIAGSPAAGDTVQFQVNRTVASDSLGVDARLHGIQLYFTTNAATDA